jgi:dCMP deaminase
MSRIELDEAYMQMAEVWANRSKAQRKKVGALIVNNKQIISDGYNGMPAGTPEEDECCECVDEHGHIITKPEVLHAESNAITKLAAQSGNGIGADLYVTLSPCKECAKLIIQTKIKRVIYREQYRLTDGLDMLRKYHIEVVHLENRT